MSGASTLLRPGAFLGLPEGVPDVTYHLGLFRYLVLALVLLWAALAGGSRTIASFLAGILFAAFGLGFWVLALGRPYGLFVEAGATRRAAAVSVASVGGDGSFLAGEPGGGLWTGLAGLGVPPALLVLLPTVLPLFVLPALALLVRALWAPRDQAALAAFLWLAFSTGDLETLRGVGFIPGLWSHPEASLLLTVVVAVVLALGRTLKARPRIWPVLSLACLAALAPVPAASPGIPETLLLLTLDQGAWLPLGVWGLLRSQDPSSRALSAGGGLAVLAGLFGFDVWGAHALYRMGLILASSGPVGALAASLAEALSRRQILGRWGTRPGIATGLMILATVPGSFLAWWHPNRQDLVAEASLEPLSSSLLQAMAWVKSATAPDAVFLASPEYAPTIAVLTGRRVLRAPTLATAPDDERRLRAERLVLSGLEGPALFERYGLTHVFIAPGDFRSYGIRAPEDLEGRGRLVLRYADAEGRRVYELEREVPARGGLPLE